MKLEILVNVTSFIPHISHDVMFKFTGVLTHDYNASKDEKNFPGKTQVSILLFFKFADFEVVVVVVDPFAT